ncbi:hypothetical protein C2845_PM05G05990 [Panicum miliaceum]|uniref:Uncharacterized protein n=1 Tax=Panicum miliaceum TaxID=4540 RepID=A0A3L6SXC9_PANMI|nr:hypothetical protein C2845_PM05G05990 [Panicum miliaceum]
MAVVDLSPSVEAHPAPHSVAHPHMFWSFSVRPRLPPRAAPTRWRRPLPSLSISISNSSADSGSGTAKRLGHAAPTSSDARLIPPCTPRRGARPITLVPRRRGRRILCLHRPPPAGQGLSSSATEYQTLAVGIEVGAVHLSLPPRLLQPGMGLLSHLLWWRRREQERGGRRTDSVSRIESGG